MKKILILTILLLMPITSVFAYENQYLKIDIPDSFKQTMDTPGTYQWVNGEEGANYVVSIGLKEKGEHLFSLTDEEKIIFIAGFIEKLENQYYTAYQREIDVELVTSEDALINGNLSIFMKLKIENFLETGSDMYQYVNVTESERFLYSIIYSTAEKTYNEEIYNQVKKSFEIKDPPIKTTLQKTLQTILNIFTMFIILVLGIFIGRRLKNVKTK